MRTPMCMHESLCVDHHFINLLTNRSINPSIHPSHRPTGPISHQCIHPFSHPTIEPISASVHRSIDPSSPSIWRSCRSWSLLVVSVRTACGIVLVAFEVPVGGLGVVRAGFVQPIVSERVELAMSAASKL